MSDAPIVEPPPVGTALRPLVRGVVRTALARFAAGLVIVLVDLNLSVTIAGEPASLDFVPDAIGWILILVAVLALAREDGGPRFPERMLLVRSAAAIAVVDSLFPWGRVPLLAGIESIAGLAVILGAALFAPAMRGLSLRHGLPESPANWRWTQAAILALHVAPIGWYDAVPFLVSLGLPVERLAPTIALEDPAILLPLLVILAIPALFTIRSAIVMRREIAALPLGPGPVAGSGPVAG